MDKVEYWLLSYVVTARDTLGWIIPESLEFIERRPPGFTDKEIANAFERLFRRGDILAFRPVRPPTGREPRFVPSRAEIDAGLRNELAIYYELTPKGGDLWERVAAPDWDRFLSVRGGSRKEGVWAASQNREILERYLAYLPHKWREFPVWGSEMWETVVPWQATYWKTLPLGHAVRFQIRRPRRIARRTEVTVPQYVEEWFEQVKAWYTPVVY